MTTEEPPRIVVGIDDSPNALVALAWAVDEALRRGWVMHAVHARRPSPFRRADGAEAEQEVEEILLRVLGAEPWPVPVIRTVVHGDPGPMLVDTAHDADLLVVGTHSHGPVGRLVLGSVSQYCARHTPCPLVIVPTPPPVAVGSGRLAGGSAPGPGTP